MDAADCSVALAREFPGRAFGPPRRIEGGWSFHTFAVDDLIVRFPVSDLDARGLRNEWRLLPELAPILPVPIPQYTHKGEWRGRPFGAYRAIGGLALDDPARNPTPRAATLRQIGGVLRALHTFPLEQAAPLVGDSRAGDAAFWDAVFSLALPLVPGPIRALATRHIERHLARGGERQEALVHRDLGFGHILAEGNNLTGIIDWTDACIGDPAKDFVGILARAGWPPVRTALEAYGLAGHGFKNRIAFFAWVAPLHDILYGLDTDQPEHVSAGIAGVERRMRLTRLLPPQERNPGH